MRFSIVLNRELDPLYASYYIAGLSTLRHRKAVDVAYRCALPDWLDPTRVRGYPRSFRCYLLMELEAGKSKYRLAINHLDGHHDIDPYILDQVDVMFKANYNPTWITENLAADHVKKIRPAGLFFPFALPYRHILTHCRLDAELLSYLWRCMRSSLRQAPTTDQLRRLRNARPQRDVFFACSAYADSSMEDAKRRNDLISRLRKMPVTFVGGFLPTVDAFKRFPENVLKKGFSRPSHMRMLATSRVTVCNRGMVGSYPWKLGEQLALGCCILSEPNLNTLPVPLIDGEHLVFLTDDISDIEVKLNYLLQNEGERRRLGTNAARLFDEALSPEKVSSRLLHEVALLFGN